MTAKSEQRAPPPGQTMRRREAAARTRSPQDSRPSVLHAPPRCRAHRGTGAAYVWHLTIGGRPGLGRHLAVHVTATCAVPLHVRVVGHRPLVHAGPRIAAVPA